MLGRLHWGESRSREKLWGLLSTFSGVGARAAGLLVGAQGCRAGGGCGSACRRGRAGPPCAVGVLAVGSRCACWLEGACVGRRARNRYRQRWSAFRVWGPIAGVLVGLGLRNRARCRVQGLGNVVSFSGVGAAAGLLVGVRLGAVLGGPEGEDVRAGGGTSCERRRRRGAAV